MGSLQPNVYRLHICVLISALHSALNEYMMEVSPLILFDTFIFTSDLTPKCIYQTPKLIKTENLSSKSSQTSGNSVFYQVSPDYILPFNLFLYNIRKLYTNSIEQELFYFEIHNNGIYRIFHRGPYNSMGYYIISIMINYE